MRSPLLAAGLVSVLLLTSGTAAAEPSLPSASAAASSSVTASPTTTPRPTPTRAEASTAGPPTTEVRRRDLKVTRLVVTTTVDSDRDGVRDVVRVVTTRPRGADVDGRRLATVINASPYFTCCRDVPNHDADVALRGRRDEVTDSFVSRIRYDGAYWARRGYAYARVASLGSNRSTGCPTIGDDLETAGPVALIDWLNGGAPGRAVNGTPLTAGWSTGDAAMVGLSYDGTLANMVAATGVEGLKAIVPSSAISSWYDYYRQDGLVVAPGGYQGEDTDILATFNYTRADRDVCAPVIADLARDQDRATGDYSPFWGARNLVPRAGAVTAGVLIAHGFADTNVKPSQAAQWYDALRAAGAPTRIWWDDGGHGTFVPNRLVTRWLDHFLYGERNGVRRTGAEVTVDGRTRASSTWPRPGSRLRSYGLRARGSRGALTRGGASGQAVEQSFTDRRRQTAADVCREPRGEHALTFATTELARGLDLSGTPVAHLSLAFDRPAANVTAALCVRSKGRGRLVTTGWADPQNVDSLATSDDLVPGAFYDVTVRLQPVDQRLPRHARMSLAVLATDADFTLRPRGGTRVSLDVGRSRVQVPVVPRR